MVSRTHLVAAIPGIATAAITAIAPLASWQALWVFSSSEPVIKRVLDNPDARAVTGLYLQFASVFVGLLVAVITAVMYLAAGRNLRPRLVLVCCVCIAVGCLLFAFVFLMGGAATVDLKHYTHPGEFRMGSFGEMVPSTRSWLTWVRVVVVILGALLAFFAPRQDNPDA